MFFCFVLVGYGFGLAAYGFRNVFVYTKVIYKQTFDKFAVVLLIFQPNSGNVLHLKTN
jgi:hypothetical protein